MFLYKREGFMEIEINSAYFKVWEKTYNTLHYYSYERFLKNLCNDEYYKLYTEEEGNNIVKRFQEFHKKKIDEIHLEEIDDSLLRLVHKGQEC